MPKRNKESFLGRVRDSLPDLYPAEKRLGEFLCDFPGEIASYNAQELAKLAKVSKATVSRFVRRLGFDNYEQARRVARKESQTGSRLFLSQSSQQHDTEWLAADIEQGLENLVRTFDRISEVHLDKFAGQLLAARKVWVIGFRSSFCFATYLQWQLMQVIENIVAIPQGGETLGEHLAGVAQNDCVIVFALRRRIAVIKSIMDVLVSTGADIVYITDEGAEQRNDVNWHFRCQTLSSGPLFNHVSVMALCHQMITRAIVLAAVDGRTRLRRIESLNERFNEL